MIKAILFDIHGVLFSTKFSELAWQELAKNNALIPSELDQLKADFNIQASIAGFLQEFCPLCNGRFCAEQNLFLPHNITLWLKGKRGWKQVHDESVQLIDSSYEVKVNQYEPELMKAYLRYFLDPSLFEQVVQPLQSGMQFLSTLKNLNKFKLFVASNSLGYCFEYYCSKFPQLMSKFDDYFFSENLQQVKPDFDFFDVIAQKHNVRLNEMFIIDDNGDTIAEVAQLGISGWCFEDDEEKIKQLFEKLKKD